jgi:hypothetical protein
MQACMLELMLFWNQKEGIQIFEWSVDIAQKTKSMYISNFEMVYFKILK